MRLGVFGGSFDPPHLGHLLPLIDAAEMLRLDRVLFVPAATQPLKIGGAAASAAHRMELTRRLVAGIPGFEASAAEVDRPGLSYMVDTLSAVAAEAPRAQITLVLGADAYALFAGWKDPERIRRLASLAVMTRGEERAPSDGGAEQVELLRTRRVDISSTELRARVADGRTIRGFVPDAVADYIAAHRLYR